MRKNDTNPESSSCASPVKRSSSRMSRTVGKRSVTGVVDVVVTASS